MNVSDQILGFATSGEPILPRTAASMDTDVIRREKLSWDEITMQSAKVVSFIGKLLRSDHEHGLMVQ